MSELLKTVKFRFDSLEEELRSNLAEIQQSVKYIQDSRDVLQKAGQEQSLQTHPLEGVLQKTRKERLDLQGLRAEEMKILKEINDIRCVGNVRRGALLQCKNSLSLEIIQDAVNQLESKQRKSTLDSIKLTEDVLTELDRIKQAYNKCLEQIQPDEKASEDRKALLKDSQQNLEEEIKKRENKLYEKYVSALEETD